MEARLTIVPLGVGAIRKPLNQLIKEHNLPPVVFHSLRHSSVTYKLKLNGGDIKAVQGDSGHFQVSMVTDVYSHILDDDRKKNAKNLLIFRAYLDLTERIFRLPEFDLKVKKVLDNKGLNISVPDRD